MSSGLILPCVFASRSRLIRRFALVSILLLSQISVEVGAQNHVGVTTLPVSTTKALTTNKALSAAASGCPNQGGVLNSISVPVAKPLELALLLSQPAPLGGAKFRLSSGDKNIVRVGDRIQFFQPEVTIAAGQTVSPPFTVFGIAVGQTTLTATPLTAGFSGFSVPLGAWDVNEAGTTKFLDANPTANHCRANADSPDLSTDPAKLV